MGSWIWSNLTESKAGRFLSNPLVGLLVTTALGFLTGYFFFYLGEKKPHLMLQASPVRTSIVQSGNMSDLTVVFRGRPVTSDLTAMQVAIWNAGKGAIRHENILQPIAIISGTNNPIYEVTIRSVTRGVVGLTLGTNDLMAGKVTLDWKILERNDGASVQILYGGDQKYIFSNEGIIEGQGPVTFTVSEKRNIWTLIGAIYSFLFFSITMVRAAKNIIKSLRERAARHENTPLWYFAIVGGIFTVGILIVTGCLLIIFKQIFYTNTPPFNF